MASLSACCSWIRELPRTFLFTDHNFILFIKNKQSYSFVITNHFGVFSVIDLMVNPIGSNVYFERLRPEGGSFLPAVFINIFKSFYHPRRQMINSVVERQSPLMPATWVQLLTEAIFCCKIFSYKSNEP